MEASLDGVRLKLVRAEEHFQSIVRVVRETRNASCKMIPEEYSEDNSFGVLRVDLSPKPPVILSIIIGEFLFDVRSALDHLLWQLVLVNGQKPGTRNMFPITSTSDNFAEEVKRGRLNGISKEAHTLIETLQPYHAGNEPLSSLADLHNFDKHRTLHLVTAVARDTQVQWSDTEGPMIATFLGNEELRDGAIFGDIAMPLDTASMKERFFNMKVEGHASTFVALDYPGADELEPFRVDTLLQEILECVRDRVLPAFEPFFN